MLEPAGFHQPPAHLGGGGGSAVGVAANCFAFALGTETDGSIISPSSMASLVGIKPTVGLTSRAGVIPISEHMDTVGPFGRTVADAVAALDAIIACRDDDDEEDEEEDGYEHASAAAAAAAATATALLMMVAVMLGPTRSSSALSPSFVTTGFEHA